MRPTRPQRRPRSTPVTAFFAATAAIIAWAGLTVPMPYVEVVPSDPRPVESLIEVDGVEVTPLHGSAGILTVTNLRQPPLPALGALLDPDRELTPYHEVYPPQVDRDEYLRFERERFARQFDVAVAVGAEAAGIETRVVTEVVVLDVLPGSPADGVLELGDVILTAGDDELGTAEELQRLTRNAEPGDTLEMTIVRDGRRRTVAAELTDVTGEGDVRLGVAIETGVDEVRTPFDAQLRAGVRIGGPSAGLIVALAVYDLLSEDDLLAGRTVLGTGTLDADGRVGVIGGLPVKLRAAEQHGADVILVPAAQLGEARAAAAPGQTVIGVDDLAEAIAALEREPV